MIPQFAKQTTDCGERTRLVEQVQDNESTHPKAGDKVSAEAQAATDLRRDHGGVASGIIWA